MFANPSAPAVDPNALGVRYFGPGVHRPGKMTLASNETIYLAGGAVVYGCIAAVDATNINILGPGVLDSSEMVRDFDRNWDDVAAGRHIGSLGGCIHLRHCKNVTIDGPTLRDPPIWCLATFGCTDVAIVNVKLIGLWRYNADGIDICNSQNVTVRHCFVRSFDDTLAVKGMRYWRTSITTSCSRLFWTIGARLGIAGTMRLTVKHPFRLRYPTPLTSTTSARRPRHQT